MEPINHRPKAALACFKYDPTEVEEENAWLRPMGGRGGKYSHSSVISVPVISTVDITGPKNAPQAPRERGMWTAITFTDDLLNLLSGRSNLHKSELILQEWNAILPAQIARRSASRRTACPTGPTLS